MPFVPVAKTALVEFRMTYGDQKVENTLWFTTPDDVTAANLTTLGGALRTWWQDEYASLCVDEVELREVVLTDQTSETGPQVSLDGGGSTGIPTDVGMPGNVSLTASFRTALRGRAFRGRNYLVGIPITQIELINRVVAGYITNVVSVYSLILSTVDTGSFVWSAVSRFSGSSGSPPVPTPRVAGISTPITSIIVVDNVLDSQRRRLPGRGQ